ncbi:MAG: hypothetical protein M5R36_09175 [Deltaproteobacteria bacterium]|nr:hypothetical protein [Deltaproteobacteria bacterium]
MRPARRARSSRPPSDSAQELDINYVIVTRLQYWPGTTLFETFREKLLAGENPFHLSDGAIAGRDLFMEREREFYRRFYVRPRYIARNLRRLLPRPGEIATNAATLARYLVSRRQEDFI